MMELVTSFRSIVFLFFIPLMVLCGLFLVFSETTRRKARYSPFTESSLRLPGHTLRQDLIETGSKALDVMYLYLAAGFGAVLIFLFLDHEVRNIFLVVLILFMSYQLYSAWHLFEKCKRVRLGLEGEEYIGQELNLLMCTGAHVFHDIPFKYGNIDHIVIGNDCVFVVETKAISKPRKINDSGKESRDATVRYDGKNLKFSHHTTREPIEQVLRAAEHVRKVLRKQCNSSIEVIPVLALPGWYIELETDKSELLVINGKRGKALYKRLVRSGGITERNKVAVHIESVARSAPQRSKMHDPNGRDDFDFWFNPKYKEPSLA